MNKKLLYTACLALTFLTIQAQQKATKENDLNREMVLERAYNPVFKDASRIDQLPQITEPSVARSPIQYQFNTLSGNFPLQWKTILPEKKMGQPDFTEQKGYVNFGIGMPTNTYGNAGILLIDDAANKLSFTLDHRLSNDRRKIQSTGGKQSIFSTDNALQGNYSHESEKSAIDLAAGYKHSAFNYFGTPSDIDPVLMFIYLSPAISDKHQIHNNLFFQGELKSLEKSTLEYKAKARYGYFGKKLSAPDSIDGNKEHHILLEGEISGSFMENSRIGLDIALNNFIYNTDKRLEIADDKLKPENYGLFEFTPHYDIAGEKFNVRLGLKSEFEFANKTVVHLAPNISGKWEFASRFFLNGNIGGGSKIYSFEQTDLEYRYLNPAMRLKDTFTPLDATVSIRTNAIPMFGFELLTGYKSGEEYYMTSDQAYNRINVLTPHLSDIKQFKVGLLAQFNYEKKLDLQFKLMKYSYNAEPEETLVTEIKAWNKPDLELSLDGNFKADEKLSMQMNYYLATGRYALVNGESVKMNAINNLSIGGRYAFTKQISAFAQMNNILFQKYDLWYGMPAQNFNFVAGVGLTF